MSFMHSHNLCHLDIKRSNVFITFDGQFVLGDLGAARPIGERVYEVTESEYNQDGTRENVSGWWVCLVCSDWFARL